MWRQSFGVSPMHMLALVLYFTRSPVLFLYDFIFSNCNRNWSISKWGHMPRDTGQHWVSSSIAFHLLLLRQSFSLILALIRWARLPCQYDPPVSVLSLTLLLQCWGHRHMLPTCFYVGSGGPHACIASALPDGPSPQNLLFFFFLKKKFCLNCL